MENADDRGRDRGRDGISPRTFVRYFPSKKGVVVWDEYEPLALDLLESRPDDEPLAKTFRSVIREILSGLHRRDPERLLARVRLAATVLGLRARFFEEQTHGHRAGSRRCSHASEEERPLAT